MSVRLEGIKSEIMQPTAIVPVKINSLPQELLEEIFFNLNKIDLQAAVCVNRMISTSVNAVANFNEPASIKHFIKILIQKLNAEIFLGQREILVEISENITPQNFVNLRLLKGYILGVKAQLINVIKTLDEEAANDLRDHVQPPHFLEDVFELVVFERQIDAANLIPNEFKRGSALRHISKALTQAGSIDRAIVVATSIRNEFERGFELRDISKALTQAGNIDRAIVVATSIPNVIERGFALRDISKALTQAGNIDRAIVVATSIPDVFERGSALRDISEALTQAGNIDRAIVVATSIPNVFERWFALGDISRLQ